jgi:hypothetical protein
MCDFMQFKLEMLNITEACILTSTSIDHIYEAEHARKRPNVGSKSRIFRRNDVGLCFSRRANVEYETGY